MPTSAFPQRTKTSPPAPGPGGSGPAQGAHLPGQAERQGLLPAAIPAPPAPAAARGPAAPAQHRPAGPQLPGDSRAVAPPDPAARGGYPRAGHAAAGHHPFQGPDGHFYRRPGAAAPLLCRAERARSHPHPPGRGHCRSQAPRRALRPPPEGECGGLCRRIPPVARGNAARRGGRAGAVRLAVHVLPARTRMRRRRGPIFPARGGENA